MDMDTLKKHRLGQWEMACGTLLYPNYPGKRPQTVRVRSESGKSRDLDALGSRAVMVVMK